MEEVTKDLPNISASSIKHLDANGIVKIGTWVTSGDILIIVITGKKLY